MAVSYKRLQHLLIEKDISTAELMRRANYDTSCLCNGNSGGRVSVEKQLLYRHFVGAGFVYKLFYIVLYHKKTRLNVGVGGRCNCTVGNRANFSAARLYYSPTDYGKSWVNSDNYH